MLTTKEVRAIIRKHDTSAGTWYNPIWTNKVKNTSLRHVKIYSSNSNAALLTELREKAGAANVKVTAGSKHTELAGIIVRCVLA